MSKDQWSSIVIIFMCWVVIGATGNMSPEEGIVWPKYLAIAACGGIVVLSAIKLRRSDGNT